MTIQVGDIVQLAILGGGPVGLVLKIAPWCPPLGGMSNASRSMLTCLFNRRTVGLEILKLWMTDVAAL